MLNVDGLSLLWSREDLTMLPPSVALRHPQIVLCVNSQLLKAYAIRIGAHLDQQSDMLLEALLYCDQQRAHESPHIPSASEPAVPVKYDPAAAQCLNLILNLHTMAVVVEYGRQQWTKRGT